MAFSTPLPVMQSSPFVNSCFWTETVARETLVCFRPYFAVHVSTSYNFSSMFMNQLFILLYFMYTNLYLFYCFIIFIYFSFFFAQLHILEAKILQYILIFFILSLIISFFFCRIWITMKRSSSPPFEPRKFLIFFLQFFYFCIFFLREISFLFIHR